VVATKTYIMRSVFTRKWFATAMRMSLGAMRRRVLGGAKTDRSTTKKDSAAAGSPRRRLWRRRKKPTRAGGRSRLLHALRNAQNSWRSRRAAARARRAKRKRKKANRRREATSRRRQLVAAMGLLLAGSATVAMAALDPRWTALTPASSGEQTPEARPEPMSARVVHGCPVRARPSRRSSRIGRIGTNAEVLVLDSTRYFWKIQTSSGLRGYALKGCLARPTPQGTIPSG
jgi:hypothetical protein